MDKTTLRVEANKLINFATQSLTPVEVYDGIGYRPTWSALPYGAKDIVVLKALEQQHDISTHPEVTDVLMAGILDTSRMLQPDIEAMVKAGRPTEEIQTFATHPETIRAIASSALHAEAWGEHITAYAKTRGTGDPTLEFLPAPNFTIDPKRKDGCPYAKHAEVNPIGSKFSRLAILGGELTRLAAEDQRPGLLLGEASDRQKARKKLIDDHIAGLASRDSVNAT